MKFRRLLLVWLWLVLPMAGLAIDTLIRDPAIRPTTSNYTDSGTLNFPWKKVYSAQGFYENGVKLTNSAGGTAFTNIGWVVVSNVTFTTYFPELDNGLPSGTNGTLLTYTAPAQAIYRIEFSDTFNDTNSPAAGFFDGRFLAGVKWTDPQGNVNAVRLLNMPNFIPASEYNYGLVAPYVSVWYGQTFYLTPKAGTTITITNNIVLSWSPGDASGWNYFNATLSTIQTNGYRQ